METPGPHTPDFARQLRHIRGWTWGLAALWLVLAVVVGAAAWAAFAFWLHAAWIGVAPFPRG